MRVLRLLLGLLAVVIALPLLASGVVLWEVARHRAPDGSFSARLEQVSGPGYAVVVPDVDTLLRRDAPFARGDRTTLRITARSGTGPAFVGLAPWAAVQRYLDGVPYTGLSRVRLARGALPVATADVSGAGKPTDVPAAQPFWITASATGTLKWTPASLRAQRLALVVMDPNAAGGIRVSMDAAVRPAWLGPTIWGLLALGLVAVAAGLILLGWPPRRREVVYVVEPGQLSDLSQRLGLPKPSAGSAASAPLAGSAGSAGDGAEDALGLFTPAVPPAPVPIPAPSWLTEGNPEPEAAEPETAEPDTAEPEATGPDTAEQPVPVPAGQGTYRSVTSPAPITPSFEWPPIPAENRERQPH